MSIEKGPPCHSRQGGPIFFQRCSSLRSSSTAFNLSAAVELASSRTARQTSAARRLSFTVSMRAFLRASLWAAAVADVFSDCVKMLASFTCFSPNYGENRRFFPDLRRMISPVLNKRWRLNRPPPGGVVVAAAVGGGYVVVGGVVVVAAVVVVVGYLPISADINRLFPLPFVKRRPLPPGLVLLPAVNSIPPL